jgi:hypothetical protein
LGRVSGGLLLGLFVAGDAQAAISVVCAPEKAVASGNEPVEVRAWVTDDNGERLRTPTTFTWRTMHGSISGDERASWRPTAGASPVTGAATSFEATATVLVDARDRGTGTCDVRVLVELVPRPPVDPEAEKQRTALLAARIFLLPLTTESTDYGLRSYLVFTNRPRDDAERERYARVVEAYLQVLVPAEDFLSQNVRASQLSVTMLPVTEVVASLSTLNSTSASRAVALDVLSVYDYATAQRLIADLGVGEVGGGPYLVARATRPPAASEGKLLVDMSGVAPSVIWDWITYYCWLTGQERSWGETAVRRLGLNIRNVIAATADATPVVLTSMVQSLYVLKLR